MLLTIGLSTTLTAALPVFAETTDGTAEEVPEEEGSGSYNTVKNNVADITDAALQTMYESSSSYDVSMQYLVTYNILKGTYLEGSEEYADIYSNDVSGTSYGNAVGKSIKNKVRTGAQEVIYEANGTESDIDTEAPTEDGETAKETEADKLTATMAETAANEYMKPVNSLLGLDGSDLVFGPGHYLKDKSTLNRTAKSKQRKPSKEASTAMKKSLVEYFKYNIGRASDNQAIVNAITLTFDEFKKQIFVASGNTSYNYFKNYGDSSVGKNHHWADATASALKYDSITTGATSGTTTYYYLPATGFNDKLGAEKIKEMKILHQYSLVTNVAAGVENKAFASAGFKVMTETDVQSQVGKLEDLKGLKDLDKNVGTGGVKTLAWTPLIPFYDQEILAGDSTKFKAALEDAGIKTSVSEDLITLDENDKVRALQLGDLFFKSGGDVSPIIMGPAQGDSTVKDYIKLSVGGISEAKALSNSSIGNFIGIKTNSKWFGFVKDFKSLTAEDLKNDSVTRGTMRAITASGEYTDLIGNKTPLGIDNYGNIITGETGEVVIPYWHNTMFLDNGGVLSSENGKSAYFSHPVYNSKTAGENSLYELLDSMMTNAKPKEVTTSVDDIMASGVVSDTASIKSTVEAVQDLMRVTGDDKLSTEKLTKVMKGQNLSQDETIQVLALLITAGTKSSVSDWNAEYIKLALESGEMYVGLTAGDYISGGSDTEDDIERWTAASIIQKIGLIFDWGFAETIRITLADMMINFYNSSFASTGLTNIFYTPNVTDSGAWTDMLEPLGLLLLAFTPIYILFMVFKVNRGTATAKDIIKQFIMLALIFLIPIVGYGAFTDMLLNKPAEWILGNQLKQTVVLDYFLDEKQAQTSKDDSWAKLFGNANEGNKLRTADNYILTFYTTTDKDGFEIDDPNNETNMLDEIRTEALTRGADWNKSKLVSVNVSMFDLYNWATAENKAFAAGEPATTLFDWLESSESGKMDEYDGVSDYEEYYTNTNTIFDTPNTAGGVLKSTTNGENITASELFKRLHRQGRKNENNVNYDLRTGLESLSELMNLFVQSQKEYYSGDTAYYVPSVDDLSAVMRDLSMTGSTRKVAFGSSGYSKFTSSVMAGNADTDYPLSIPVNIPKPTNDIFGIYNTVEDLNPYLASGLGGGLDKESLEKMTYDINYDVLTQLANVYSLIPNSTNISADNVDMGSALQMATVSEIFFQLNDEMGFKNFPTSYAPGTVSTDNYLKMIFIPFQDYGINQSNFAESEVMTNNVAEYLAERENSAVLFMFIVATLCLAIYGLFMLAVFYGFMLVLTLYSFILNYIIKNNYKNKSWLGVLGIYTVLGLVKFGLVLVWYVMTTILNYQYMEYDAATYPFVMIHAIVIIAYLFFISKFVIVKLFSAVYKDKENLGGEAFSAGLSKMKDVATAKTSIARGRNRPMGDVAGNSKRKFGNMARGTGKYAKGAGKVGKYGAMAVIGAGTLGALGGVALASKTSDTKVAQAISRKIESGKQRYYYGSRMDNASQAVGRGARNFGRGVGNMGRGAKSFGFTIAHPLKALRNISNDNKAMNYKNNAQKSVLTKNLNVLGEIPKAVNGVAASAVSVADTAGKVYGAKEAATATMFTLGSSAAAKVFAKGLENTGRLVKTEGTKVFVESTADDLSTVDGRAALVDEGVTNIQNQADKYNYSVQDTKLKGLGGHYPVMYGQAPNGAFNLLFSDKNGLDTRYYEKMTDNKEFRENFTVDPSTVQRYADGRIKPESQIKVIPKSSSMTKNKAQQIFQNLYREDNAFREDNNYKTRKGGDYQSINLAGIPVAERAEYLKDAPKGVMLNDNSIMYNPDNRDQRAYVSNLKQQLQEKTLNTKNSLSQDRDSLISYVKEGQGHGLPTHTFNSKEDVLVNQLFGNDLTENSIAFNTGDKHDTEQITSYISSIQNLDNVAKDDSQNYYTAQSMMHSKGKEVMTANGNKDAVEKSINFLSNKYSVNNTQALNSIVNTKENIDLDLSKGAITPEQAEVHYNQLFDSSLKLADDSNYINDMLREHASKVDVNITDKFNTAKRAIETKYKINPTDIDKIKWDENSMADYKDAFGGIKNFKVEDNIGRIDSKDSVQAEKVSKLVEKATSKSFKEKSYDTGYKAQTDKNDDIVKPTDALKKVVVDKSSELRKKVMNIKD